VPRAWAVEALGEGAGGVQEAGGAALAAGAADGGEGDLAGEGAADP
jgi:hypothetical protein